MQSLDGVANPNRGFEGRIRTPLRQQPTKQPPLTHKRPNDRLLSFPLPESVELSRRWMALINQFPLGKCAAIRIREWEGRRNQGRKREKDHHPLHAQNNSWLPPLLRSDPINTAGQGTTPTLGTTTAEMISVLPPSSSSLSRCSLRNFSHHYYSGGFQRGPL